MENRAIVESLDEIEILVKSFDKIQNFGVNYESLRLRLDIWIWILNQ
jgi:hypothetical protein